MSEQAKRDAFGVYVHWPFCQAKCPYCDFNSHVRHGGVDQADFAVAYSQEIAHVANFCPDRKVTSIFFGGGTPSLMEPETVGSILDAIGSAWTIPKNTEISMEANPGSVEAGRFAGYRAAGVNRLSIGVQSLDDRQLKLLGRLHTAHEAVKAVETAQAEFDRTSVDLIYSRPGQTIDEWQSELRRAISLGTEHLSLYQLTIEQGTPFYDLQARGKLRIPDGDQAAELFELTAILTQEAGLPAYEISNHAKPGAECRHNLVYWRHGEYAGIGPGAHGRLNVDGKRIASAAKRVPEDWLQSVRANGHGFEQFEALLPQYQADEMLLMGLRLREGLSIPRYEKLAGQTVDQKQIDFLVANGLLERPENDLLRATPAGFMVLDAVIADLAA